MLNHYCIVLLTRGYGVLVFKGPWRLSRTLPVQRRLSIEFLAEQGLFNLEEYWGSLRH